ncbi:MarR family transcriptional regulator [Streptomyces sp. NPDC012825]|uniref:MarR family transcriptional regulator n=1 Tax=Streptomyces sp. NPDC012825 TaxID=3364851 RepID=UPI00368E5C90
MNDDPDDAVDPSADEAATTAEVLRLWEALELGQEPASLAYRVLTLLERFGRTSPGEVAHLLAVSSTSMSRLTAQLTQDGLVVSTPAPGDGRSKVISVTPAGKLLLDELRAERLTALVLFLPSASADSEAARDGVASLRDVLRRRLQDRREAD